MTPTASRVNQGKKGKCKGSSSFLKKRTKKLLLSLVHVSRSGRANQQDKSFCFFKKEILPSWSTGQISRRLIDIMK
jgi:hypothetical protein